MTSVWILTDSQFFGGHWIRIRGTFKISGLNFFLLEYSISHGARFCKNDFLKKQGYSGLWYIKLLFFIAEQKYHIQPKIGAHLYPHGRKTIFRIQILMIFFQSTKNLEPLVRIRWIFFLQNDDNLVLFSHWKINN